MINTVKDLLNSNAKAVVISESLRTDLIEACPHINLTGILKRDTIEQVREVFGAGKSTSKSRKGVGGRKAIPDPEDESKLNKEELLRFRNRKWKRESRERLAQ